LKSHPPFLPTQPFMQSWQTKGRLAEAYLMQISRN
jgi:hypothetical protein